MAYSAAIQALIWGEAARPAYDRAVNEWLATVQAAEAQYDRRRLDTASQYSRETSEEAENTFDMPADECFVGMPADEYFDEGEKEGEVVVAWAQRQQRPRENSYEYVFRVREELDAVVDAEEKRAKEAKKAKKAAAMGCEMPTEPPKAHIKSRGFKLEDWIPDFKQDAGRESEDIEMGLSLSDVGCSDGTSRPVAINIVPAGPDALIGTILLTPVGWLNTLRRWAWVNVEMNMKRTD